MYKLIIFDVDGTLVTTKSGATFRKSADDWQLLPGRQAKIAMLHLQGIKLAIATNQGGVAFGYFSYAEMSSELYKLAKLLHIALTEWCETHPKASIEEYREDSDRRKPKPGMLLKIIKASGESKQDTLMVGDRPEDEEAAKNAGVAFQWAAEFFKKEE